MTRDQACQLLIAQLEPTWPQEWRGLATTAQEHPLVGEARALTLAETCHLPFFQVGGEVSWITVAPDSSALRAAVTGLRAWIIPSLAWEHRSRPVLRPEDYSGSLAPALAELCPAGYYRWRSTQSAARIKIPPKLRLWRQLLAVRPNFVLARPQTLFELREQFRLALATGDRDLAEQAITAIDQRQLDTAANTLFMRMQMRARFGSYREITEEPRLSELLRLRLPHKVRIAIVEAFYEVYLREDDHRGDRANAAKIFREKVHPTVASLLGLCRDEDGHVVERTLRYYRDAVGTVNREKQDEEAMFFDAVRRGDWRRIQESGSQLLNRSDFSEPLRSILPAALTESLKFQPSPDLAAALEGQRTPLSAPQSWSEFVRRLRKGDYETAKLFLELPERPVINPSETVKVREIVAETEELFTDPACATNSDASELLGQSLPFLIEDLVGEPEYPRSELAQTYLTLLQLWTQQRATNLQPADPNAAISLAAGVLSSLAGVEIQTAELLRRWWQSRQVRIRLPFLLETLDLLADHCQEFGIAQGLWIDGVTFIRAQAVALTLSEHKLWRSIGQKLGFDKETLDEYLAVAAITAEQELDDPLQAAALRKIAIVSLHEKAAQAAAALIRERTNAEVLVVSELVAGRDTKSARTADVVLLVWAATKHSVYRAFDDMRDKIAYVQGTGVSSVVLALERWVLSSRVTNV